MKKGKGRYMNDIFSLPPNEGMSMDNNINEIAKYQNIIARNNSLCRQLNEKVDKLEKGKNRLNTLIGLIQESNAKAKARVNSIPELIGVNIKKTLFLEMVNYSDGGKYSAAMSDLHTSVSKMDAEIRKIQEQIDELSRENSSCNAIIQNLKAEEVE